MKIQSSTKGHDHGRDKTNLSAVVTHFAGFNVDCVWNFVMLRLSPKRETQTSHHTCCCIMAFVKGSCSWVLGLSYGLAPRNECAEIPSVFCELSWRLTGMFINGYRRYYRLAYDTVWGSVWRSIEKHVVKVCVHGWTCLRDIPYRTSTYWGYKRTIQSMRSVQLMNLVFADTL